MIILIKQSDLKRLHMPKYHRQQGMTKFIDKICGRFEVERAIMTLQREKEKSLYSNIMISTVNN